MESSNFYITLPSNASMDFYPTNTTSNYTIHMPRTIYLQGKYEVALAEIQYPHTWTTTKLNEEYFIQFRPVGAMTYKTTILPGGYYKTVLDLCEEINERIFQRHGERNTVIFKYHEATRKVYIKTNEYEVTFSKALADMLGFKLFSLDDKWYDTLTLADYPADIHLGFYTLYVYCSLCEAQVVGDYYVPLLRTVAIRGDNGDLIMKTFDQPHYVPVNTSKFDTIEMNIKDDQGENVAFESGKVLCKLHFRQRAI